MEAIHMASMDVLENPGVTFLSEHAQKIFAQADAIVNENNWNVRISPALASGMPRKCLGKLNLYAREPK